MPTVPPLSSGGILLAWLCLGEALSWTLAAGAALVIGGIILVSTEEAHE